MIDIRTMRSKYKGIRVDIHRRFRHVNSKTEKVRFSTKQIGSFKLTPEKTYPEELNSLLDPDEILQLKNWLAEAQFADQFGEEADTLAKFTVCMPQKLYGAYLELFSIAKDVGMDFVPNQIMLDSLLHKAKLVEQKIDKIQGSHCKVLEKTGAHAEKTMSDEEYQRLIDAESRTLFKALVELKQPISKTCSELEEIAKQYGKQKERISAMQLREWADLVPGRNLKRVSRWCYAAAIELLLRHGKNPLDIAPPERVAEYWAVQNFQYFILEQAKREFAKIFNPSDSIAQKLNQVLESVYKTL